MSNDAERMEKARQMMNHARTIGAPEEVREEPLPAPVMPQGQGAMMHPSGMAEMTIDDFMSAANRDPFVVKEWKTKGKIIRVKKFCKGELDRISSPLLSRSVSLDVAGGDKKGGGMPTKLEISLETFLEMEKIMVELGMSYYKDQNGKPIINRVYIDKVMSDNEFKELSAIIQEVNPNALQASAKREETITELKNG